MKKTFLVLIALLTLFVCNAEDINKKTLNFSDAIIENLDDFSFKLRLVRDKRGIDFPVLYVYPIPDTVTKIALKMESGIILYYNLPKRNKYSKKTQHRGIILIGRNDFVNIFCNDEPQRIILNPGSKDEKTVVFDSKTLQEFSEIVKQWTENQLKINSKILSARNRKTTVQNSRRRNPRVRNNRVSGTGYANETIDNKDDKFWKYMDRIFCSRNNIPYSLIDATPRYTRRNVRERGKPYPVGIFYVK